jgi:hypothetical protein
MIKNRIFALIFRITAFLLCLFGILVCTGILNGQLIPKSLLYYTIQSNILMLIFFGVLIYKTAMALKKEGKIGNNGYFPRISAGIFLAIMLTMIIYWVILLPEVLSSSTWQSLFTFKNLSVHLITPILVLIDYILFSNKGHIKKNDPFIFCIVPLVYVIQALVLGSSGVIYAVKETGFVMHFPYFFMDHNVVGLWIVLWILGLALFYLFMGKILFYLDHR